MKISMHLMDSTYWHQEPTSARIYNFEHRCQTKLSALIQVVYNSFVNQRFIKKVLNCTTSPSTLNYSPLRLCNKCLICDKLIPLITFTCLMFLQIRIQQPCESLLRFKYFINRKDEGGHANCRISGPFLF